MTLFSGLLYAMYENHIEWQHGVYGYFATLLVLWRYYVFRSRRAARKFMADAVDKQSKLIQEFQPDVIVGSSLGGAVLMELLQKKLYKGACIFLASASGSYARRAGLDRPEIPLGVAALLVCCCASIIILISLISAGAGAWHRR